MKNNLVNSFLVSLIFLVLLNVCFGTYLLEHETFLNAISTNEFSLPQKIDLSTNVFVALSPMICFLNQQFGSSQIFSLVYFILNLSILTTLIANLFFFLSFYQVKLFPKVIFTGIALLLVLPSQIVISNHYTSILMGFAACLSLYTIERFTLDKRNYILVIVLILLSYLVRFEVVSILYLLFAIYTLLYYKKLFKQALVILLISLSIQGVYAYMLSENEVLSAIFTFEHEIQDRESVNFEEMDSKEWYKFKAMGRFIIDDPNFTIQDYTNYLDNQDKLNYVFDNPDFFAIYKKKITDLAEQMLALKGYLFLFFVLALFSLYLQVKDTQNPRLYLLKFILINFSLLAVPLSLSLFLLCSPEIVFSIYFAAGFISLLHLISKKKIEVNYLLLFLVPSLIISFFYIKQLVASQQEEGQLAKSLRKEMLYSAANNKTIVFTYPANYSYYQSRLFQNDLGDYTPHYYLDLGLVNYMKPFDKHNKQFFGMSDSSLKERMLKCANNKEIVLISTEEYNNFLTNYIKVSYQDTGFEFKLVPDSPIEGELNKYYLLYEK